LGIEGRGHRGKASSGRVDRGEESRTRRQLPAGREQRRPRRAVGVSPAPARSRRPAIHVAAGLAEPARRVTIVEPKATWPTEFEAIAVSLHQALGSLALRIAHIGSTAVPGLPAKGLIA